MSIPSHDNFEEILARNTIRFFMCLSDQHMLFHPFPSKSMSQDEFRKPKSRSRSGIGVRYIPQADGSRFYAYRPASVHRGKPTEMRKISFYQKVRDEFYPECVFWPQQHINLNELEILLNVRKGYRLSYLIYTLHQFADGVRVLPLLVDWIGQTFYNISENFSQWRASDGFGVMISEIGQMNEMHLRGIQGFKVIEYLSHKRVCLGCGRPYDVKKGKRENKQLKKHAKAVYLT